MDVGLGRGHIVLDGDPAPLLKKAAEPPPKFSAHFYCGQTVGCIKMPVGMDVGLSPGDFVLVGEPYPSPKRGQGPQFSARLLWRNGWMDQGATWYGGRPQPRRHCVRWGPSSPSLKGHSPHFSVNVSCGQTVEWTKMPLCMEQGLGPADFVFDEDPASPEKRAQPQPISAGWIKMSLGAEVNRCPGDVVLDGVAAPPKIGTAIRFLVHGYCGQTAGWLKTPLGTEVDLGRGHIVLDGDPAQHANSNPPPAPSFRTMSVAATVALLRYC